MTDDEFEASMDKDNPNTPSERQKEFNRLIAQGIFEPDPVLVRLGVEGLRRANLEQDLDPRLYRLAVHWYYQNQRPIGLLVLRALLKESRSIPKTPEINQAMKEALGLAGMLGLHAAADMLVAHGAKHSEADSKIAWRNKDRKMIGLFGMGRVV